MILYEVIACFRLIIGCRHITVNLTAGLCLGGGGGVPLDWVIDLEGASDVQTSNIFVFIHQTLSSINNDSNNRKFNYKDLIKYYNLLQDWPKNIHCRNISQYKLILPCFKNTARQINSKATRTIFYYVNTPSFKNFHTKAVEGKV